MCIGKLEGKAIMEKRMDRRAFIKLMGAGSLVVLFASGCAGDASDASSSASASGAAGSSVGASSGAGYKLITPGTLTVGISADYEPFEYIENGEFKGFEIDLVNAIAQKMNLKVKLDNVDFDTIVPGVSSGTKYDIGLAAITVTPEREKEVAFTESYYLDGQVIVTKSDDAKVTEDNFRDVVNDSSYRLAAQSGSTSESIAKEDFPKSTYVPFKSGVDCFSALEAGKVDGIVTGRPVAAQMQAGPFPDTKVVAKIPTGEENAIAVNKNNPGLTEALSKALEELKADGTVDQLMTNYKLG